MALAKASGVQLSGAQINRPDRDIGLGIGLCALEHGDIGAVWKRRMR